MVFLSSFLRDPELIGLKMQEPHIGRLEACWMEPIPSLLTAGDTGCVWILKVRVGTPVGHTQALEGGRAECHRWLFYLWP